MIGRMAFLVLATIVAAPISAHSELVFSDDNFPKFPPFFMTIQKIKEKIERSKEVQTNIAKTKYSSKTFNLLCRYNDYVINCRKGVLLGGDGYYQLQDRKSVV